MNIFYFDILGLEIQSEGDSGKLNGAMQVLIELRKSARADKNWALSDEIRDKLSANGIVLKDGKEGSTYSIE
jgi:cysteinyl-tRNA synthetase